MLIRKILRITWPAFLAASLLQLVVFALIDPLELNWFGRELAWSRQAVYATGFFVFWCAAMLSSALTALLGSPGEDDDE